MSLLEYWMIKDDLENSEGRKADHDYWSKMSVVIMVVMILAGMVYSAWNWIGSFFGSL